jgi:hypothetical protein
LQVTQTIAEKFYPMQRFPFGSPLRILTQAPLKDPRVFVLGVYASAVRARWLNPDGSTRAVALAVASEPHIFWRGEGEAEILASIQVPAEADRLVPPVAQLTMVLFDGVMSSVGKISKPMI